MRIVSPGFVIREAPDDARRRRLGRAVSALIVAGWALAALTADLQGTQADRNAWLLAGIGIVTGITWGTKRFDEHGETSLQILLVAASLQATAATLAFDRGIVAAFPFALLLAVAAGQVGRTRSQVAAQAGVLVAGQLMAAAFGPDRAPQALDAALGLVVSIALLAAASAAVRELREQPVEDIGDIGRLHDRLAAAVAAHPERFAVLTMDVSGLQSDGLADVRRTLAAQVRGSDVVARDGDDAFSILAPDTDGAGAAALARRIADAMADYRRAETGHLNAAIGIAVYPEDGRTPDELLASADAALAQQRAAGGRRMRIVSPALR
jgi:hypothetical protein